MAAGHGVIINLSTGLPFTFELNPMQVKTKKDINYFESPNIGGHSRTLFFSGFSNKKVSFSLLVLNMEDPLGVAGEVAYWDQLRSPGTGLADLAASFIGNENHPPPKVLYQFGASLVPMPWWVRNVEINVTHFHANVVGGVMGIPKRAIIDVSLELDEESDLFKANRIAERALEIGGSVKSVANDIFSTVTGARREQPGILPAADSSVQ